MKRITSKTFIKYLLTYIVLATVIIAVIFFSVRHHVDKIYKRTIEIEAATNYDYTYKMIKNEFIQLNQIHASLGEDIRLIMSRYKPDGWNAYQAYKTMENHSKSNMFVRSIVYLDFINQEQYSTGGYVTCEGNDIVIHYGDQKEMLDLDMLSPNVLITSSQHDVIYYVPQSKPKEKYQIFYVLNKRYLRDLLEASSTRGLSALALISESGEVIESATSLSYEDGAEMAVLDMKSPEASRLNREIMYGYYLVGDISNDMVLRQVNVMLNKFYYVFLLVIPISALIIYVAMRVTYNPLHKLVNKHLGHERDGTEYVRQLDELVSETLDENNELQNILSKYRLSMHSSSLKALFDQTEMDEQQLNDILFQEGHGSTYHVLVTENLGDSSDGSDLSEYIPKQITILELGKRESMNVYLVTYLSGCQELLDDSARDFYINEKKRVAISSGSGSAFDIPWMLEQALRVSEHWNKIPVVFASQLENDKANTRHRYPYEEINCLREEMINDHYQEMFQSYQHITNRIQDIAEQMNVEEYINCEIILVELLVLTASVMNKRRIPFELYGDKFFEALSLTKDRNLKGNLSTVLDNLNDMLQVYQKHTESDELNPYEIMDVMESRYCQYDLSIQSLADEFDSSVPNISYAFKKYYDKTFSDMLWDLRFAKAIELLFETNMTIKEVSHEVGYLYTSSFRRRFKLETGMTPVEYRQAHTDSKPEA